MKAFIARSDGTIDNRAPAADPVRSSLMCFRSACVTQLNSGAVRHQPDLAVLAERNRIDPKLAAFAVQPLSRAQVVAALVQGTDHGRAAQQSVGKRPVEMGTFG